jgi:hypothetical protein
MDYKDVRCKREDVRCKREEGFPPESNKQLKTSNYDKDRMD